MARALTGGGYRTVAIGVTRAGGFRLVPDALLAELRDRPAAARAIDDQLEVTGPAVELRRRPRPGTRARCRRPTPPATVHAELDVVFPVLHGPFGEDGVVQGLLESLGVPYVGCGILASAVGMNKVAMKRALRAEGVPITPYVVVRRARPGGRRPTRRSWWRAAPAAVRQAGQHGLVDRHLPGRRGRRPGRRRRGGAASTTSSSWSSRG